MEERLNNEFAKEDTMYGSQTRDIFLAKIAQNITFNIISVERRQQCPRECYIDQGRLFDWVFGWIERRVGD